MTDHGKSLSPIQKMDAVIKGQIDNALWKDKVLRTLDYYEIEVHVKNGTVYLNGHIVSTTSQSRIESAIRAIPSILEIKNNLVLDDKLTLEVAASLGKLEHTYDCKFFTGAAHGVVSLNGIVVDETVKLLAEKCVASNPNVRGVINSVRVRGGDSDLQDQPFLQPTIGEEIFFLNGTSGVVRQVIINPNNRRVVAMTVWGRFADQLQELKSLNNGEARSPERLIVLSMNLVRYLTRVSGFLNISSNESKRYMDFDSASFSTPNVDWVPPYPYCPDDVLFPVEYQNVDIQIAYEPDQLPFGAILENASPLGAQLIANDSLGG